MFQHELLALYLMRLHQHQLAYVGALADVQRCLNRPDASAALGDLLAQIEFHSAELEALVMRLKEFSDR